MLLRMSSPFRSMVVKRSFKNGPAQVPDFRMRSEKSSSFECEAAVGTDTLNVMCEVHQRAKSETSAWKNKVLHIVQDKLF